MATHVALLRGINVTGYRKVPMKALLAHLEADLGLRDVRTYIQSGNVVFDAPRPAEPAPGRAPAAEAPGAFAPGAPPAALAPPDPGAARRPGNPPFSRSHT